MRNKSTAAALAAAISLGVLTPALSQTVYAEEHGMGAAIPEWIPANYEEALDFRNTYGATRIKDGLVCVVFREEYDKVPEGEPQGMLRYEVKTTDGVMEQLSHRIYGSEDSRYVYDVYSYYKVDSGDFDVSLIDTWAKSPDTDLEYGHAAAKYSFNVKDEITETDMFGWLPDCITECEDYVSKNGAVSAKDDLVVFALESNAGTAYSWSERSQTYSSVLSAYTGVNCSTETAIPLDGGAIRTLQVYKAEKDGNAVIKWDYAPFALNNGEQQIAKTLVADCTVSGKGTKVTLNGSYVPSAEFSKTSYNIYGEDLTVPGSEVYDKFSESKSAVITSKDELTAFLKPYLSESALKNYTRVISDTFFDNYVLMLSTYLDPYNGRIFSHGLKDVQYKDGKLVINFTSVIQGTRMRTSVFDILQCVMPKADYNGDKVIWASSEILESGLRRVSVIDEDTGLCVPIDFDTRAALFGYAPEEMEDINPCYWETNKTDWRDISIDEKYLPDGYKLSATSPKEIIEYENNSADIIFTVKKDNSAVGSYAVTRFSTTTSGLFNKEQEESIYGQKFEPAVATSADELSDILSKYITENYSRNVRAKYGEDFFKNNVLLLDFLFDSTGGNTNIGNTDISGSDITVYYNKTAPDFGVCNTDYFMILQAAVPKSEYKKQKVEWHCMGDANSDGSFGVADLVTLQKWLLGASDVKISDWKTVDICKDDSIDSFDLVKMRKRLVENNSLEPEKYEINAKYIRTGGNYEHLAGKGSEPVRINGTGQLEDYLGAQKSSVYLSPACDLDYFLRYDNEWFMTHQLIAVNISESSGSVSHKVTDLTSQYVTIERTVPQTGTADMAEWDILIELDRAARISPDFRLIINSIESTTF